MAENTTTNEGDIIFNITNEIEISSETETAMMNLQIPSNFNVLNSLDVWIADTGATVHNTLHQQGISNIKVPSNGDQITIENGDQMQPVAIGDLHSIVTSKDGIQ